MTKRRKTSRPPRSLPIAERGINTAQEFSALISAIMADVLSGSITPGKANALLKAVDIRLGGSRRTFG